jgi:hypothetical protein
VDNRLNAALNAMEQEAPSVACQQLQAFINLAQAQSGKKILAADADALIREATLVAQALGCGRPSPAGCVPLPAGAIAWWPFDERGGKVASDIVGNNSGVHVNGPQPTIGIVDGALQFHGTEYVRVPDSDLWAFGTRDFTIEFWVNFDRPHWRVDLSPGRCFHRQ